MSQETEKVLREETYKLKPFGHLKVGDPSYFEDDKHLDSTISRFLPTEGRSAGMLLREIKVPTDNEFLNEVGITSFPLCQAIIFSENERSFMTDAPDYTEVHLHGTKDEIQALVQIGEATLLECGTASFILSTENGKTAVHTGADGAYGILFEYQGGAAVILELNLNGRAVPFEEMKEHLMDVFDAVIEKKPKDRDVDR